MSTIEKLLEREQTLFWLISRADLTDWTPRPFLIGKTEEEIVDLYSNTPVSKQDIEKYYIILGEVEAPLRLEGTYLIDFEDSEMAAHLVHKGDGGAWWILPDGTQLNYHKSMEQVEVTETISILNPETGKGEVVCFS